MAVTTSIYKGILLVKISGDFDMHIAEQFRDTIDNCMNQADIRDVLVDLEDVFFIDSSGIGVLIGRYKKVVYLGGKIILSGLQDPVRKILDLSGVLKIIASSASMDEAMADF